jgi:tetratricopeptide (TPR) repeat protein
MNRIIFCIGLFLAGLPWTARGGTPANRAAQGDAAYQAGDYESAVAAYGAVLEQGYHSASLHYNLGNAWYRLGRPGLAILHYERALLRAPRDPDVRHNLALARQLAGNPGQSLVATFYEQAEAWLSSLLPTDTMAWMALSCWWLAWAGFAWWRWGQRRQQKKVGFLLGMTFVFLSLSAGRLSYVRMDMLEGTGRVVVTEASATLRSAPTGEGRSLRQVPEGSTLMILAGLGGYWQVRLPDGETGWLEQNLAARI